MHTRSIISLAILFAACSTPDGSPSTDVSAPLADVTPVWYENLADDEILAEAVSHACIAFDETDWIIRANVGNTRTGTVRVYNLCDTDLAIHELRLTDSWGSMELADQIADFIPANDALDIEIDFTAQGEHIHLGELVIRTDDRALPAVAVNVFGLWVEDALRGVIPAIDADAGPDRNSVVGTQVELDGTGSTPNAGVVGVSYLWGRRPGRVPAGAAAQITNETDETAFLTPDVSGLWELRLDVSNGFTLSRDFMKLTAAPASGNANVAPVARIAGDVRQDASLGIAHAMSGAGSVDPDGVPGTGLTHTWYFAQRPAGSRASFTNPTSADASFVPDVPGTYLVRLRVNDGLSYHIDAAYVDAGCAPGSTLITGTAGLDIPTGAPAVTSGVTTATGTGAGFAGVITDVDVHLGLTHTFDADLDISLTSPGGTTINLSSDNGSSAPNYFVTEFDDQAATSIVAGAAPFTGSFIPEQALATFNGGDANGTWTLTIVDDASGDVGVLEQWSICVSDVVPANVDGDPANSLTDCDDNDPLAFPGNTEVFPDECGDGIDQDCSGSDCNASVLDLTNTVSYDPDQSVPDNQPLNPACTDVAISGGGAVDSGVTLTVGMSHTWIGDLTMTLQSPTGTIVPLMTRPGNPVSNPGDNANLVSTGLLRFVDGAARAAETLGNENTDTNLVACAAGTTCDLNPDSPLSVFNSQASTGNWRFCVSDSAGADLGLVDTVTVALTAAP